MLDYRLFPAGGWRSQFGISYSQLDDLHPNLGLEIQALLLAENPQDFLFLPFSTRNFSTPTLKKKKKQQNLNRNKKSSISPFFLLLFFGDPHVFCLTLHFPLFF